MPNLRALTVRLSPAQQKVLAKLAQKLGIGKADVLRLALSRLAEQEGAHRDERR